MTPDVNLVIRKDLFVWKQERLSPGDNIWIDYTIRKTKKTTPYGFDPRRDKHCVDDNLLSVLADLIGENEDQVICYDDRLSPFMLKLKTLIKRSRLEKKMTAEWQPIVERQ
jgi:hypothetical protein